MSVDIITYLMLGCKFKYDEIPQHIIDDAIEDDCYFNRELNIRLIPKSLNYEDSDLFVGVILGILEEYSDDILEINKVFSNYSDVQLAIEKKLHIERTVSLFMFHQWS